LERSGAACELDRPVQHLMPLARPAHRGGKLRLGPCPPPDSRRQPTACSERFAREPSMITGSFPGAALHEVFIDENNGA
jgi:hypothetical protein